MTAPNELQLLRVIEKVDRTFFRTCEHEQQSMVSRLPLVVQKIHVYPGWTFLALSATVTV